jgi:hypothetical protein
MDVHWFQYGETTWEISIALTFRPRTECDLRDAMKLSATGAAG